MNQYSLKDLPAFLRDIADACSDENAPVLLEECARIIEGKPINMGHMDAIEGACASATDAIKRGALGEAWEAMQRVSKYAQSLRKRLPEGDGFSGE